MTRPRDEKERIEALVRPLLSASGHPRAWEVAGARVTSPQDPIGDDCAVLDVDGVGTLVWGSDYIRGTGFALFQAGVLDYYDLGYYLVTANVSDIAAMGAQPIGVLLVLRYTAELSDTDFSAIMAGAHDAATAVGAAILGGDTGGAERVVLSASALGLVEHGRALTRSGASPGDLVFVTGALGAPAAALLQFGAESVGAAVSAEDDDALRSAWRRPEARVAAGRLLVGERLASACQDISDGLQATTNEIALASSVELIIDAARLPLAGGVAEVAHAAQVDPTALAASASVDFELLFTVPAGDGERCKDAFAAADMPLFEIGEVREGSGVRLRRADGQLEPLPGVAWRHQDEDVSALLRRGLSS